MCVFHQCQDFHSVSVTSFVSSKCAEVERAFLQVKNLSRTFINHSNFWLKMFPFTRFLLPNTGPSGIIINSVELFNSKWWGFGFFLLLFLCFFSLKKGLIQYFITIIGIAHSDSTAHFFSSWEMASNTSCTQSVRLVEQCWQISYHIATKKFNSSNASLPPYTQKLENPWKA